jgi:hypothetical protein
MVTKKDFLITILLILFSSWDFVYGAPPAPGPSTEPDLPIDHNITIVLLIALLYGSYTIYKHIKNKKASI